MSEFDNLIAEACGELTKMGRWLDSGKMLVNGVMYSYKIQQLKEKPRKTKEADG